MSQKQTVLIIGAHRGIGFELACRFLAAGYTVHGTYRSQSASDPTVAEAQEKGIKLLQLDFTDEPSIVAAAQVFAQEVLDILVNCAGLYHLSWDHKPFTEQSADDLMEHFRVNVVGPFLTSKHFLPCLMRSKQGRIINISSDFASIQDNTGGNASYKISKAALNQLTRNSALDLQKIAPNVLTLAVHPGYVATRMTGYVGEDNMEECMTSLFQVIARFGSGENSKDLSNGGYVRWDGKPMNY